MKHPRTYLLSVIANLAARLAEGKDANPAGKASLLREAEGVLRCEGYGGRQPAPTKNHDQECKAPRGMHCLRLDKPRED